MMVGMSRFQKVVVAVLAALVVAVAVLGGVIIKQQADAAAGDAYLQCLAIRGFTPEDAAGMDRDDLEALVAASEECRE